MTEDKKFLAAKDITGIALFTALMIVCTWISIPLVVPITLQAFAVFVTGGILGPKKGTMTVVAYILLGMVGVPVFSNLKGGVGVLVGPTGGYIIGFIFTVFIVGIIVKYVKTDNKLMNMIISAVAMILGDAVGWTFGTAQFMAVTHNTLAASLAYCVFPFIIPDMIKVIAAVILIDRVKEYVKVMD